MAHFQDIADHAEDERIRQIGEKAMRSKLSVAFVTDDEPGKADRYIAKLVERFPGIRVVGRGKGLGKSGAAGELDGGPGMIRTSNLRSGLWPERRSTN